MRRRIEKRRNRVVEWAPSRQGRVLPQQGPFFVHVMSRVVDGRFVLGALEKEHFRRLMRAQATFTGLRIVTYAIMDNHFHILLEVPEREEVSDRDLYRRIEIAQGRGAMLEFRHLIQRLESQGSKEAANVEKQKVKDRMYDLGAYMQNVKRQFTRWYNKRNARKGTLWEARYKSVVVEGANHPLLTIAAYIDLNPVRAGLVADPKDYRFCGYGEALSGGKESRAGLTRLAEVMQRSTDWRMVQRTYRKWVYAAGEGSSHGAVSRDEVVQVWKDDGELTPQEMLQCKVRYFSDGLALGSPAFVEMLFDTHRSHFSEGRDRGAKPIKGRAFEGLYALRDLQSRVVT